MSVLILLAHPALQRSRVNRPLLEAVAELDGVTVHDLYRRYPDFFVVIDDEQTLLRAHRHIVLQFPMRWYSVPALLKEWLDRVLEYRFAYGQEGTALHGKSLSVAVSSGGREQAFQREGSSHYSLDELLRPLEQTAHLCGMDYRPPFWVAGGHYLDDDEIAAHARRYRGFIETLLE